MVDDPCNGLDDDDNGVVDDDDACWVSVYAFAGAGGTTCYGTAPTLPPAGCAGYERLGEGVAFVLPSTPVPGTAALYQCTLGDDHLLVTDVAAADGADPEQVGDESVLAWEAVGYDCSERLGHAYVAAPSFDRGDPERGARCALTRYLDAAVHHARLGAAPAPDGASCEATRSLYVFSDDAACGAGEVPEPCRSPACPARTAGAVIARTVPDDTAVAPDARVTQVWTVQNTGDTTWSAGWGVHRESATTLPTTLSVAPEGPVAPGEVVTVTVVFTAPARGVDEEEIWVLSERRGAAALVYCTLRYDVATDTTANLRLMAASDPVIVAPGAPFDYSYLLTNTGTTRWTETFHLVLGVDALGAHWEIRLGREVAPGDSISLLVRGTAPVEPGGYALLWSLRDGVDDSQHVPIDGQAQVRTGVLVRGEDEAGFVAESVPDGRVLPPGTPFVKLFWLRNTGTSYWSRDWSFQHQGGELALVERIAVTETVAPGDPYLLAIPMQVPTHDVGRRWLDYWELVSELGEVVPLTQRGPDGITYAASPGHWLWAEIVSGVPCLAP